MHLAVEAGSALGDWGIRVVAGMGARVGDGWKSGAVDMTTGDGVGPFCVWGSGLQEVVAVQR